MERLPNLEIFSTDLRRNSSRFWPVNDESRSAGRSSKQNRTKTKTRRRFESKPALSSFFVSLSIVFRPIAFIAATSFFCSVSLWRRSHLGPQVDRCRATRFLSFSVSNQLELHGGKWPRHADQSFAAFSVDSLSFFSRTNPSEFLPSTSNKWLIDHFFFVYVCIFHLRSGLACFVGRLETWSPVPRMMVYWFLSPRQSKVGHPSVWSKWKSMLHFL